MVSGVLRLFPEKQFTISVGSTPEFNDGVRCQTRMSGSVFSCVFLLDCFMTRIVLFENIHPSATEVFSAAGLSNIVTHASSLPPDALRQALEGADLVGIRSRTHLD